MIVGFQIAKGIWKICLNDFLSKLVGKKIISLFTDYEVIKPLPMYDCIVDGVVMTVSGDNLLSSLEVVKWEWACQ